MSVPEMSWLNIVTVGLAAVSAAGAWFAAAMTRRSSEAQLVLNAFKEYGSVEMLAALRTLRRWHTVHGETFASDWFADLQEHTEEGIQVDLARRRVSSYFLDAVRLHKHGLMTERALKAATSVDGLAIWLQIVERLERELDPTVDLSAFRKLRGLCAEAAERGLIRPIH